MKKILLKKNIITLVDDEDFEYLKKYKWIIKAKYGNFKVFRFAVNSLGKNKMIFLHREIMRVTDPAIQVIHLNRDSLDNQKKNLHVVNRQEASTFRENYYTKKELLGVSYLRSTAEYIATISKDGIEYHLGIYFTSEEAAMVYDKAALELYGKNAITNKKQGLIKYNRLTDITIDYSNFRKSRKIIILEGRKNFSAIAEKIIELKKKHTFRELGELFQLSQGDINKIVRGRRGLSKEKTEKILSIIKEKNL